MCIHGSPEDATYPRMENEDVHETENQPQSLPRINARIAILTGCGNNPPGVTIAALDINRWTRTAFRLPTESGTHWPRWTEQHCEPPLRRWAARSPGTTSAESTSNVAVRPDCQNVVESPRRHNGRPLSRRKNSCLAVVGHPEDWGGDTPASRFGRSRSEMWIR